MRKITEITLTAQHDEIKFEEIDYKVLEDEENTGMFKIISLDEYVELSVIYKEDLDDPYFDSKNSDSLNKFIKCYAYDLDIEQAKDKMRECLLEVIENQYLDILKFKQSFLNLSDKKSLN